VQSILIIEEEDFTQSNDHCVRAHPLFRHFEPARVKPNKANIPPMSAGWTAQLTVSTFNRLGQYASSPGYRAYCHAELAVSSLVVAKRPSPVLIPPTHRGMARLSWPRGWLDRDEFPWPELNPDTPVHVLTGLSVKQLCWCDQRHYH